MYESFFGLKEKPFTLLPDPEYLYLSSKHQRALIMLQYGLMNRAGFSVICGDIGAGKTTLIRQLLSELNDDVTVGMISNTHKAFGDLLSWVLEAFGLSSDGKSKAQMHREFTDFLIQQYANHKHTVLIVDEAQNMDEDRLEELRMLSNVNADKNQVLQVILAGQPGLRDMLRKPELLQFAQRIAVDYYLGSLDHDECCDYIRHRLEVARAQHQIFSEAACDAIFKYTGGTPRLINMLCDTAMVYAFAEQVKTIDAHLIEDVVKEQVANGVAPAFKNIPQPESDRPSPGLQKVDDTAPVDVFSDQASSVMNAAKQELDSMLADLGQQAKAVVSEFDSVTKAMADEVRQELKSKTLSDADLSRQDAVMLQQEPAGAAGNESDEASASTVTEETETNKDNESAFVSQVSSSDEVKDSSTKEDMFEKQEGDYDFNHQGQTDRGNEPKQSQYPRYSRRDASYYQDLYPVVQVDESDKKSRSYLILGMAIGMFLATLLVFTAGYFLFFNNPWTAHVQAIETEPEPVVEVVNAELEKQQVLEAARMDALQKERDAAVAMTRALERERDAAIAAAKAQEEMREAERRAAELMVQQERRTAEEIQRAREQARKAEIAAAKARERERLARRQAEQARIDAEKARLEKQAVASQVQPVITPGKSVKVPEPPAPVYASEYEPTSSAVPTQNKDLETDSDEPNKFSANPCNGVSAKFLSTCKK